MQLSGRVITWYIHNSDLIIGLYKTEYGGRDLYLEGIGRKIRN